jgi:hypothetical protein
MRLPAPIPTRAPARLAAVLALVLAAAPIAPTAAAPAAPAAPEPPLHGWLMPPPQSEKRAYFSNLADGASIETPFVLRFGLSGEGLASINGVAPGAGHHHLLVDRELPLDFTKPLPFNDQYIHFGKGQMETVLTFPPGRYTLRLVLADNRHIPDFVYSKPLHLTVTARNAGIDPKALVTHDVSILSPGAGEHVHAPFRIGFHASGFNVSNVAVPDAGSGHFRLHLQKDAGKDETVEFDNGHTEAWLRPPPGHYVAQVDLVDNLTRGKVLAASQSVAFDVTR